MKHAIVVVLGDIGHSPRMGFHVKSLVTEGHIKKEKLSVEYVGYVESTTPNFLKDNELVSIVPIRPPPASWANYPSIISLFLKFLWLFYFVPFTLIFRTKSKASLILVQNPPGVPVLLFAWLASKLKGAILIIDWHNYTSSIIRYNYDLDNTKKLKLSQKFLTFVAKCIAGFEGFFGRRAKFNLCVSNSMRHDLREQWKINALRLYDRPPAWKFKGLNDEEKHQFFRQLCVDPNFSTLISQKTEYNNTCTETNIFSYRDENGKAILRNDRPLLLISSTSWTKDEDFGILLEALRKLDTSPPPKRSSLLLSKVFVVITGKGPMKEHYLEIINKIRWRFVTIVTPWLKAEDYPKMLGCADIGVSLHASTSGLDLPMKVVDMLGCRIPVLAKKFKAIDELVTVNNGRLFNTFEELCALLIEMSSNFPKDPKTLNYLKIQVKDGFSCNWESQWESTIWPLMKDLGPSRICDKNRQERFSDDTYSDESI